MKKEKESKAAISLAHKLILLRPPDWYKAIDKALIAAEKRGARREREKKQTKSRRTSSWIE